MNDNKCQRVPLPSHPTFFATHIHPPPLLLPPKENNMVPCNWYCITTMATAFEKGTLDAMKLPTLTQFNQNNNKSTGACSIQTRKHVVQIDCTRIAPPIDGIGIN